VSLKRTAWIDKVIGRVLDTCAFIAGCLVVFQMITVCLEVFLRYFLNRWNIVFGLNRYEPGQCCDARIDLGAGNGERGV